MERMVWAGRLAMMMAGCLQLVGLGQFFKFNEGPDGSDGFLPLIGLNSFSCAGGRRRGGVIDGLIFH